MNRSAVYLSECFIRDMKTKCKNNAQYITFNAVFFYF